jgi:hypothetical protein
VLVTQPRGADSFNLRRSPSISSQGTTTHLGTARNDGMKIQMEDFNQENVQTTTVFPFKQEDDFYDDYSSDDGPAEFVDLDAIIQPTLFDRSPVTGLFKLANSNDWIVVDRYYMDRYYFGDLGDDLTAKEHV